MSATPPPLPPQPLNYAVPADGVACPKCGQFGAKAVTFTWWGGLLGPKLLSHTKCALCGFTFNRKTGKSNNTAIGIYLAVGAAVGLAVGILIFMMRVM